MSRTSKHIARSRAFGFALVAGLFAGVSSLSGVASVPISDIPLSLPQSVPGNLFLVPSVEFPTVISKAHTSDTFSVTRRYTGYFDSQKCYDYVTDAPYGDYFMPKTRVSGNNPATCGGSNWSGNFLNWALTQTIDPFRSALTGGYRVVDEPGVTILEKAIFPHGHRDKNSNFPNRTVPASDARQVMPLPSGNGWANVNIRLRGLGNKFWITGHPDQFSGTGEVTGYATAPTARSRPDGCFPSAGDCATGGNTPLFRYHSGIVLDRVSAYTGTDIGDPAAAQRIMTIGGAGRGADEAVFELSARVRVCVAGLLEPNCVAYGSNYKPEGLIQEYSQKLRYSAFSYRLNSSANADGGVMRARMKYVGPNTHDPLVGVVANANREWNPTTGVFIQNPDAADASATVGTSGNLGIVNSGVINYINKFGQLSGGLKAIDPVSELYYTAIRYLKNQGPVAAYNTVSNITEADHFPIIRTWDDPIQYQCQVNVLLGIGDTNTHVDKNLPGPTSSHREPTKPAEVSGDSTVDVVERLGKIASMQGATLGSLSNFTVNDNSAYVAALAYDAHTRNQRPDKPGANVRASTYWVDVLEYGTLKPSHQNQYYLAAKYGGFRVPDGYDAANRTDPLPATWWNQSGERLSNNELRPDNFFVAGDPDSMVAGLRQAFARIMMETQTGAGAALAATSTQVLDGGRLFQGTFRAGAWSGDLKAYGIDPDTYRPSTDPEWSAAALLDARSWTTRKIYTSNSANQRVDFTAANAPTLASGVADYIRGNRANEGATDGKFRPRESVLGDIVHSQPVYVPATSTHATRRAMVYVGANDGMLHGFDAATGEEVFGFVPRAAIGAAMNAYAKFDPLGFQHRYFVDGEITVREVGNRTYLVGTMGRGAPGIFALDVTDPDNMTVVWDKTGGATGSDIPLLGNSLGKPVIAEVDANTWYAVVGNGPNSATGAAGLIMVALPTGTVKTVNLGGSNNGLSGPVVWRPSSAGYFNVAYAGDITGRLWKISDLEKNTPDRLTLYNAARPITAAPQVARRPASNETWIFFGTGQYLNSADRASLSVNTWYGIRDDNSLITGKSQLLQRKIIAEGETPAGVRARGIEAGTQQDLAGKKGWYIDLVSPVHGAQGERIVSPLLFQGLALVANTRIPDGTDPCAASDRSWIMALDPFTGARFGTSSYFDINDDGEYDDADMITLPDGTRIPNSGIGQDTGTAGIITVGNVLYAVGDDGSINPLRTNRLVGTVERVSWREVLLYTRNTAP